jgi:hypothetical protein
MNCNVGGLDRAERIFHGIVFLGIGIFLVSGLWQYILGGYGVIRLLTGIFAFCPAYIFLNHTTRRTQQ